MNRRYGVTLAGGTILVAVLGTIPRESLFAQDASTELPSAAATAQALEPVRVGADGKHFVAGVSGKRFVVWGVNYDHDSEGRLLDEYWIDEWKTVVEDFQEIKELGANCVRIHLQFGKFMDAPAEPNMAALQQLTKLVKLAEDTGLYLDVTGLACYHKSNIPDWYDRLGETDRWEAQAQFWEAIARTCKDSAAIFCYDLMNEPVLPGKEPADEWLTGELGGKYFTQRLALSRNGRTRPQIADQWVTKMVDAIRKHDHHHMVTVGVIPWVFVFGGGKPLFHSSQVGRQLDFVSVHFYPKQGEVTQALRALKAYEVGKPLVIEEMFPLKCSNAELVEFVKGSAVHADGWLSFYWGRPAQELRAKSSRTIAESITASWLSEFRRLSDTMVRSTNQRE